MLLCAGNLSGVAACWVIHSPRSVRCSVLQDGPRRSLLLRSASATLASAASGYAVGFCLGIAAACLHTCCRHCAAGWTGWQSL